MSKILDIKNRWISVLRAKASGYEHSARKRGEIVCSPSLDAICNEIEAFFAGMGIDEVNGMQGEEIKLCPECQFKMDNGSIVYRQGECPIHADPFVKELEGMVDDLIKPSEPQDYVYNIAYGRAISDIISRFKGRLKIIK